MAGDAVPLVTTLPNLRDVGGHQANVVVDVRRDSAGPTPFVRPAD